MKRIFSIFLILVIMLSAVNPAYCEVPGQLKKLGRGLWNLATCPAEIPNRITKTYDSFGFEQAATYGLLQGIVMMGFRAMVGLYEALSFPIPMPPNYEPIFTDPEFFFFDKEEGGETNP